MTGNNKRGRGDSEAGNSGRLSPIARELNSERGPVGDTQRFPRSLSGGAFGTGDPVKQYPKNRRCHVCGDSLSVYNPGPGCSRHPSAKMVMQPTGGKIIRIDSKKVRKTKAKKANKK